MPYRKRTLRRMTPLARKLAHLAGELESAARRLKNALWEVQSQEMRLRATEKAISLMQRKENRDA